MKLSRAAVILAVLMLAGCQGAIEEPLPAATEIESEESQPEAETEPEVTQEPEPAGPQDCQPSTQMRIEESIDSQTAAFGLGEYEDAYAIASPSFQESVTLEGFIEIISGSYGPLIGSSELAYRDCMVDSSETIAVIDVRFIESGNSVYGLRYLMVRVEDVWRVDGASNLQVVGEGA
ncbi:MAG: DUF4864 domain-containing protein [Aquiluna sp.]